MKTQQLQNFAAILLAAFVTLPAKLGSQVAVQDDKGRSTLQMGLGGFFGVNTGDGSAEVSYYDLVNNRPLFAGLSLKAKSTDGIASLFQDGELRPTGFATATFGYKKNSFILVGRYGRGAGEAALVDSTARPTPTFSKRTLYTWDGALQMRWLMRDTYGFGVAIGKRRANNYEELSKATTQTTKTSVDSANGTAVNLIETKEGRLGAVIEGTVNYIDADFLWVPAPVSSLMSFRAFVRTVPGRPATSPQRNGIGVDVGFHTKNGDVIRDRLAAFVIQVDEARAGDKKTDFRHRINVSVVTNLAPIIGALLSGTSKAQ